MAGVPGIGVPMSSGCSRTTASIDVGSILLSLCKMCGLGDNGRTCAEKKGPSGVLM